jgi:hypothetical protein
MPIGMRSRTSAHALVAALLAVAIAGPAGVQGGPIGVAGVVAGPVSGQSVDLGAALAADGTFVGIEGLTGSVDPAGWLLVSDLSAGEPPRFAQASQAKARKAKRGARRVGPAVVDGWEPVGSAPGSPAMNDWVLALAAKKKSTLYVGGEFYNVPTATGADALGTWDGTAWGAVSGNDLFDANPVSAIAVDGSDLYVGGPFQNAADIAAADRFVKWDGGTQAWEALGNGLNAPVRAIAVSGSNVYVGGDFTDAAGLAKADYVARWDGTWHAMGANPGNTNGALADRVNAIAVDGGNVYVGGLFTNAAGIQTADYLARWDGGSWSTLGSNPDGTNGALGAEVFALLYSGPSLFVGGNFQDAAGDTDADFVARWGGGAWHAIGTSAALDARVYALAKVGEDLYVGGHFLNADGIPEADRVVRWDGSSWQALGSNGSGGGAIPNTVYALAAFDGYLYVGGAFVDAAGMTEADHLARYPLEDVYRPDARVRQNTSGPYKGDGIYNANAKNQKLKIRGAGNTNVTFQISLQNDSGTNDDTFRVDGNGSGNSDFTVTYLQGSTDITRAVNNGTYVSAVAATGNDRTIKVRIRIKRSASTGEQLQRTITITSVGDPTKSDTVKVTAESTN